MEVNSMGIRGVFRDRHLNVHYSSWGIQLDMNFIIELVHHF